MAEAYECLLVAGGDLLRGHRGDPGQGLTVEQEQSTSDSVGEFEVVVVEQSGDQLPALVVTDGAARGAGGDEEDAGVPGVGGPAQEVARLVAGGSAGQPGVNVGLAGLGERMLWSASQFKNAAAAQMVARALRV